MNQLNPDLILGKIKELKKQIFTWTNKSIFQDQKFLDDNLSIQNLIVTNVINKYWLIQENGIWIDVSLNKSEN